MKHIRSFGVFENQNSLTQEQTDFLNGEFGDKWTLNPSTGLVDVDIFQPERYYFVSKSKPEGIRYGVFKGKYFRYDNKNTSLDLVGLPREIIGDFSFICSQDVDSLKGLPEIVSGNLYIDIEYRGNKIGSLEGLPKKIGGNLNIKGDIKSLKGLHTNIEGRVYIDVEDIHVIRVSKSELISPWYWVSIMLQKYNNIPKENPVSIEDQKKIEKLFSTLYTLDDFKRESEKNPQNNPYLELTEKMFINFFNVFVTKIFIKMDKKEEECFSPFILDNLDKINAEIQKDPEGMMMKLRGVWNSPVLAGVKKEIKIPDRYKEEMDTLADLTDLGF
jgi:hypothetical protein